MLETVWESRWLPDYNKNKLNKLYIHWFYQWFKIRNNPDFEWLIKYAVKNVPWKPNIENNLKVSNRWNLKESSTSKRKVSKGANRIEEDKREDIQNKQ